MMRESKGKNKSTENVLNLVCNFQMLCWTKEENNDWVSPSESKYRSTGNSSTHGSRSQLKSRPRFENIYSHRQGEF